MDDLTATAQVLAKTLAQTPNPATVLPDPIPCSPLLLLRALHAAVRDSWLTDLDYARRAGLAAAAVGRRYPDDLLVQAQAHWTQGNALMHVPEYIAALAHFDRALDWYAQAQQHAAPMIPTPDVREVQIARVGCLAELGRYTEAQRAAEAAEAWLRERPNAQLRVPLLVNMSMLAGSMGDYVRMVDLADTTVALAIEHGTIRWQAYGWINRALACTYLGRFDDATTALDKGIYAAESAGEPVTVARAHCNYTWLLRCQGRLFDALKRLRLAEAGMAQAAGEAPTIALTAAALYENLYQLPEALEAAHFAAREYARQVMPTYSAGAALQAVRIAIRAGRRSSAFQLLDEAKLQAAQVESAVLQAEIAVVAAQVHTLPGQQASPAVIKRQRRAARGLAAQAHNRLLRDGLHDLSVEAALAVADLDALLGDHLAAEAGYRQLLGNPNPAVQIHAHTGIAQILAPVSALPHLQRAAELTVIQRRTLPMEELQARYSSDTMPHHTRLAACYLALGQPAAALECVWEAKSGALLDLRATESAPTTDLRAQLDGEKANLARWRAQLHEQHQRAREAVEQEFSEAAAFHQRQAEQIAETILIAERRLTATLRTLGDRGGQGVLPRLVDVQATLRPGMALLEYVRIGDDLGCFRLGAEGVPVYRRLGPVSALGPLLDRWNLVRQRAMEGRAHGMIERTLAAALAPLRALLIDPWRDELATVDQLLVAPWGALHHVPWAMLVDLHVLALSVTVAGALWASQPGNTTSLLQTPRLLGYAGEGDRFLPHVANELAAIAVWLPAATIHAAATSTDLRAGPAPSLLHIAAHGQTNPTTPLCSTIELADGPFLLLEAHRLQLHGTGLVVLSACETGERPDHGDMVLALVGAFLCAGARAVIASLWPVDDAAAADLMRRFYADLATGTSPAAALRAAQTGSRTAFPLDWAAFQIWIGSGT